MGRYQVNPKTHVIHDRRAQCDDAQRGGLREVGFREFRALLLEGFNPCDHCFRDDDDEAREGGDN